MQFAPDGRLFVCEQGGRLRVIKNGALLSTPFLTVTVSSSGERGLLGVAFDPDFAVNQFVYVYYTATSPTIHNRVSRFTANGDVAVRRQRGRAARSREPTAPPTTTAAPCASARTTSSTSRSARTPSRRTRSRSATASARSCALNTDGSIPTDNPFFTHGDRRQPGDLGARPAQPVHVRIQRRRDVDVHQRRRPGHVGRDQRGPGRSELRLAGLRKARPPIRGSTPRDTATRTAALADTCAIAGGAFYTPADRTVSVRLPRRLFLRRLLRRVDPQAGSGHGNTVTTFATGISSPVDLKVADDGSLYYLARVAAGDGVVYRITYGATAPTITSQPSSRTVAPGTSVTFSVRASGPAPLRYQWQRNGANISGATVAGLHASRRRTGRQRRAVPRRRLERLRQHDQRGGRPDGDVEPGAQPPRSPRLRRARFTAAARPSATRAPAPIPKTARCRRARSPGRWTSITIRTSTRSCPRRAGRPAARFTIPTTGHTESNVWYRIYLTVRDAAGATQTVQRDILPRKVSLTLATNPAGLQLRLDGQPIATPLPSRRSSASSAASKPPRRSRRVERPTSSCRGRTAAPPRTTSARPRSNTTYTATYRPGGGGRRRPVGHLLQQRRLHRDDRRADRSRDRFHLGHRLAGSRDRRRHLQRTLDRTSRSALSGTYTFYTVSDDGVRLWVNGVQLVNHWSNHGAVRGPRHDRVDGRAALLDPHGVLRERRQRDGTAALEPCVDRQGAGAGEPAFPRRRRRRSGSTSSWPRRRFPPATCLTAAWSTARAATARPTAGMPTTPGRPRIGTRRYRPIRPTTR